MKLRALWLCLQVLGDVGRETLNESFFREYTRWLGTLHPTRCREFVLLGTHIGMSLLHNQADPDEKSTQTP
jgi:hypothetical protein